MAFQADNDCERCGRTIKPGQEVWVEMGTNGTYYADGVPEGVESQGCFLFGSDCARKVKAQGHK